MNGYSQDNFSLLAIARRVVQDRDPRIRFLKLLFILSVSSTIAVAVIPNLLRDRPQNILELLQTLRFSLASSFVQNVCIGVLSSVVATCSYEFFDIVNRKWADVNSERELRELFGCEDINQNEISSSVALVLPARYLKNFTQEDADNSSQNLTLENDDEYEWIKDVDKALHNLNSSVAVGVDILVSASIASVFSKYKLPIPKIIFDNEVIKNKQFKKDSPAIKNLKTFIIIGLYSNRLTSWLYQRDIRYKGVSQKYFYLERNDNGKTLSEHKVDFKIKLGSFDQETHNLLDENKWHHEFCACVDLLKYGPEYNMVDDKDIALFSKLVSDEGGEEKTFVIVGAAGEKGTKELGGHINKQWKKIYESIVKDKYLFKDLKNTSNYSLRKCSFSVAYFIQSDGVYTAKVCVQPPR